MSIPSLWTNSFFDEKRLIGDPLADGAIQQLISDKGPLEAKALFNQLIRNIDLPIDQWSSSIHPYLEATNQLPEWADWEQIQRGNDLFLEHGPKFLVFLYYKSLPLLYTNAKGAPVLTRTSRLTNEDQSLRIFARRVAETGQFLMDVMAPDALKPGAKGIRSIQKIRLIHASIRAFYPIPKKEESLGIPINQEDQAMTLMTFSISLLDALEQFKLQESPDLMHGYLHTWTAIGHNLGLDQDLLPQDLEQAHWLYQKIEERTAAPSEAGKLLTRALLEFAEGIFDRPQLKKAPRLLLIHMLGKDRAKLLGLNTEMGCLGTMVPTVLKKTLNLSERLEDQFEQTLPNLIDFISMELMKRMVAFFDNYKGRQFEIPEVLKTKWLQVE